MSTVKVRGMVFVKPLHLVIGIMVDLVLTITTKYNTKVLGFGRIIVNF